MAYCDSPVSLLLILLSTLFPALALDQHAYCYTSFGAHGVQSQHCERAMEKIIYDANQTLDNVSGSLTVSYKSCVINIRKPKRTTPNRVEIETVIHNVTRSCPATGGVRVDCSLITKIHRSNKHNHYVTNRPHCRKSACGITPRDCLDAFGSLPVDDNGFFTAQDRKYNSAQVTKGSCMVKIATTDYAPFRTSPGEVDAWFHALIDKCQEYPGVIHVTGGTTGYNGDVKISYRAASNEQCI